jgi:hypothetical protein
LFPFGFFGPPLLPVDFAIAGEDIDVDSSAVMTGGATMAAFPNVVTNARRSVSIPSFSGRSIAVPRLPKIE